MTKLAAAAVLAVLATPAWAQSQEMPTQRAPATAEGRLGWDYQSEAPALGLALRFPVFGARGDVLAGGEAVFHDGLTETQVHVDALVAFGGRSALTAGGGPVLLSSAFEDDGAKETRLGYSLVAALRQLPAPDETIGVSLELRWLFVDELRPRYFTLAVGLPLFRMPF